MTPEQVRTQGIAKHDQNWAMFRGLLPEIERIAEGGFRPTDTPLIRAVMHLVAADLYFRAATAIELEAEPPTPQEPANA